MQKAVYYGRHTDGYLFVDDSGLEVDALGGAPGVYSARYAGPDATDAANNALVLERLRGVTDRAGRFVCVVALAHGGRLEGTFRGTVEGQILHEARGPNGFGYDPIFFIPEVNHTMAELGMEEKNCLSHRARAIMNAKPILKKIFGL